jgi:hypothetical protein
MNLNRLKRFYLLNLSEPQEKIFNRSNGPPRYTWRMPGRHQEMYGPGMLQASGADQSETKVFAHLRGQNLMRRSARGGVYYMGSAQQPPPQGNPPRHFPPGVWSEDTLSGRVGP